MIKKYFYFWTPPICLMLILFTLSSFSNLPTPVKFFGFDKIEHMAVYLVLSLLFYRALMGTTDYSQKKIILLSIIFTSLYGLSDEIHQSFVPGREASIYDLIFDIIGAVLAYSKILYKIREIIKNDSRMFKV